MKKLFLISVICAVGMLAFASGFGGELVGSDDSATNVAANGLFGTDADDLSSITGFQGIFADEQHFFGAMQVNSSIFDAGVAWKTKGGTFMSLQSTGYLPSFSVNSTKLGSGYKQDAGSVKLAYLLGLKDFLGVRLGFEYLPGGFIENGVNEKKYKNFTLDPFVHVGLTLGENTKFTPYFKFNLPVTIYEEKNTIDSNDETLTKKNTTELWFRLGTGISLAKKDNHQHGFSFDLYVSPFIFTDKTEHGVESRTTETEGKSQVDFGFRPRYTLTYEPDEKIALKFRGGLPLEMKVMKNKDYDEVDGNKTYNGLRKTQVNCSIAPEIMTAFQWKILPEKLTLTVGGKFAAPSVVCGSMKNEYRYNQLSDSAEEESWSYGTYNGGTMHLTFGSALKWDVNEHFSLDCGLNVLNNLLNHQNQDSFWGFMFNGFKLTGTAKF